ncbi:unnamed protein product [Pleuronectes platessa]|uniref:Uncharacterized protein n=1 Tax=Pleuronectes platessa TaxID=8262 RepID=A0A9N7YQA0_PLEPL|nr:unnamed protein product [Pleuronectes platessa]
MQGTVRRLSLNTDNQTGSWQISVDSNSPYSVKVIGQSPLNLIHYLLEAHDGARRGLNLKEGRPLSGGNLSLLVFVAGSDQLSEVNLFDSSGPTEAQANNTNIEPGSTISIPFTVATTNRGVVDTSATETFTVRATNDHSYPSSSPSTVTAEAGSGGTANGTGTLTVPGSAVSGTDVTLTIVAENAAAGDFNYAVLRFSVVSKGNGTLNTSTVAGAGGENITVVTYSASCCAPNVVLAAVDNVGNVGKCERQVRESTTAAPVTPRPGRFKAQITERQQESITKKMNKF